MSKAATCRATLFVRTSSPVAEPIIVEEMFYHSKEKCHEFIREENAKLQVKVSNKEYWRFSYLHVEDSEYPVIPAVE